MHMMDIKQSEAIEFWRPGVTRRTVLPVELQQTAPIGVPAWAETQDIGDTPALVLLDIVVAGEEIARRIPGGLSRGAADVIKSGNQSYAPEHLRAVQNFHDMPQRFRSVRFYVF